MRVEDRENGPVQEGNPVLYKPLPVSHIRRPMAILSILLTVVLIAVSILMVLIVLVQRPKQEGLGAAFGGGTLDSALGAHTTDVLAKMTTWLGILFFVCSIGLAMIKTREFRASAASDVLEAVEEREPEIPGFPPSLTAPAMPAEARNSRVLIMASPIEQTKKR
ncbi:MAG: preprotein translocase subunit SecG, partial [Verrucomicrobiota bacterium]